MNTNPYAPPKAEVADIQTHESSPPLWNPNAAANWSLLFSPVFGAFLHMKNWQALGEPARASASKVWAIAVLLIIIVLPLMMVLVPGVTNPAGGANIVGFLVLVAWYIMSGRPQIRYVKQRFGKDYPRKGWAKPLLFAVAGIVGYFLVMAILGGVLGGLLAGVRGAR